MNSDKKNILFILGVGILAWIPALNFWFFKAYEATWLMSVTPHTFFNLLRGHAFLYFLDLKLFGWTPAGWYATGILLHLLAGSIFYFLIKSLTKNQKIAFISGLIFIANSAYIDVVAWGSFNSYYPLLLIFMLLGVYFYHKYLMKRKIANYALACVFIMFGFFVRETGLVIVPLLTVFDILYTLILSSDLKKILKEKNLSKKIKAFILLLLPFIRRQIMLYLLVLVFILIRNWYGGISGDYADSLVKWRVRLINDGLYLELTWAMILTSGKLIAAQLIPYPILNLLRNIVGKFLSPPFINVYFFPVIGMLIYGTLTYFTYKIRKNKNNFFLMVFFLAWVSAFSLFVSLAVPSDSASLSDNYLWIPMRYRYFAFAGMSVMYSIILYLSYQKFKYKFKNPEKTVKFIVAIIIAVNVVFLWFLERDIYKTVFAPGKEFYLDFKKEFPTLPKNPTFYLYPHTSGLNDYMLEWYFIQGQNYKIKRYQIESQMQAVIKKIKEGQAEINSSFFLDYSQKKGLINRTPEARKAISNTKEYRLSLENIQRENNLIIKSKKFDGPPIEIPLNLILNINSNTKPHIGSSPNSQRFRMLADYVIDRKIYLDTVKIKTSITMSQRENEPFFHVLPSNLIDGNIGPRSSWIVNDGITLITADLGRSREIHAITWGSAENSPRIPASYIYEVSTDQITWTKVKEVKNNIKSNVIDVLDKPISARYVRMNVFTTSKGDFAQIDEFEIIGSLGKNVLGEYRDRNSLLSDSLEMFKYMSDQSDLNYAEQNGLNFYFARLQWETNLTDPIAHDQYWYFSYPLGQESKEIVVPIREGEIFAGPGQFLNKKITGIEINFGNTPFNVSINSLKIVPRY